MNGKRQKIQPGLALQPRDWGEPSVGGSQGVEPSMAKSTLESPAPTDRMSPSTLNPVEPPWYGPVCPVVWEGRHREVPPYPDMGAHPVQAALLEIVDRRLDGGMLLARQCEVRLRLVCAAAGGQAALGGHGV